MRREYLYVQLTGVFDIEEACESFIKALEVIDFHKATRILVDCLRVQGTPTTIDYYTYGDFISKELLRPGRRRLQVAYAVARPLMDAQRLTYTVATNRGANVNTFESVEAALKWLGVDPGV
jgi:hypothetical protein